MTYCYASLGRWDLGFVRFRGLGLGNNLLPWARCIVAARKYDLVPIAPTWVQITPGAILRNERDKRSYFGLFDTSRGYVCGLEKVRLLARLPRLAEADAPTRLASGHDLGPDCVVVFRGITGLFAPILRDHQLVARELLEITRTKHKAGLTMDFGKSITAHVRLGDFTMARQDTDLAWFVETIRTLRAHLGADTRVHLFSDASDRELVPILELGNVGRLSFGSSIADILAMSRSRVLLGSAGSTFSMWAAYLGRMPTVWPGAGPVTRLYYDAPESELQHDLGAELPAKFIQACRDR